MDFQLLHHRMESIDEDTNELFFRHRLFEKHKFSLAGLDVCDEALQIRSALLHGGPIDLEAQGAHFVLSENSEGRGDFLQ